MTSNFPGRTNSNNGPNYHTVPILVIFSLGENLNRRQDAERSEEYFRDLDRQSSEAEKGPSQDSLNWANFAEKLRSAFAKAKWAVKVLSGSKHQDAKGVLWN